MNGSHVDALARSLTTAGFGRRALAGLFAGALGPALGASSADEAAAAKKKKPCPPCKKRKHGKCKKKRPDGTACAGGTCQGGRCSATPAPPPSCPSGLTPLANGSCARACTTPDAPSAECPGCFGCSAANTEGASYCIPLANVCDPTGCTTTAGCPQGTHCQETFLPGCGSQCVPLCTG
jgi:hypothetical protein